MKPKTVQMQIRVSPAEKTAIRSRKKAVAIITKYYPLERFPQKTLYALEEMLPEA